jgi:hypothetical protein
MSTTEDIRVDALELSLVVPAFNEAPRLAEKATLLAEAVSTGVIDAKVTELIVVDDGSTDGTGLVAQNLLSPWFPRIRIVRLTQNSGKGAAIRAGAAAAAAPVVAFMDADMSVDPIQVPLLVAAMESADLAIGSRCMTGSTVQHDSMRRVIMGRTFNYLVNAVTQMGFKDTQCGFKAFRTPMARILFHFLVVDRFAFDVDVLYLARQLGMQISEVPVQWQGAGNSTVRPVADSMAMALDVARLRWRKKRPWIPALVISAGSDEAAPTRQRTFDSFSLIRKTDPILSLPQGEALVLLPLCQPTEVNGAAARLDKLDLNVRKRYVSWSELTEMTPLAWSTGGSANGGQLEVSIERRQTHGSAHVNEALAMTGADHSASGEI